MSALSNIKKFERKLVGLQRWLARSQKGSKNRLKIRLKIQRLNQKIRNARKYYIHLITKELTDNNDIIFTEKLNVKGILHNGQLPETFRYMRPCSLFQSSFPLSSLIKGR